MPPSTVTMRAQRYCICGWGRRVFPNPPAEPPKQAPNLRDQGKYEQAEEMHRQVLRLRETVLGKEYPTTLMSMNNLAEAARSLGKYGEAEKAHRVTLEMREKILGKEHPDTLMSLSNLALVLECQDKCEEAEGTHRRALGVRTEVLAKEYWLH